jgi:tetraacyldisaccharide 4'-kinase
MARTKILAESGRLERLWLSPPSFWLRGLAWLYTLGWRAYTGVYRLGLKRRVRMPVPVIGIGSLWAGGVGKTPVTIAVARLLQEAGVRVAVLTHGYGGSRYRMGALVDPAQCPDPAAVGDEAAELRLALPDVPIAVGKQRVRMAQAAMARWSPDALVLDDGFQHLPLARTLDLVLLPAESPLGNGYCLPAGPLREPPDGLQRASGAVWVYFGSPHPQPLSHEVGEGGRGARRCALPREVGEGCRGARRCALPREVGEGCRGARRCALPFPLARLAGEGDTGGEGFGTPTYTANVAPTALLRLATGERLPLDALQERPLTLVCGVARPQRFLHSVDALGYMVAETHTFPDHHAYTPDDMRMLAGRTVLTTLKDAVKLKGRLPADCDAYALLIEAHLDDALRTRILSLFTGTPAGSRESLRV